MHKFCACFNMFEDFNAYWRILSYAMVDVDGLTSLQSLKNMFCWSCPIKSIVNLKDCTISQPVATRGQYKSSAQNKDAALQLSSATISQGKTCPWLYQGNLCSRSFGPFVKKLNQATLCFLYMGNNYLVTIYLVPSTACLTFIWSKNLHLYWLDHSLDG